MRDPDISSPLQSPAFEPISPGDKTVAVLLSTMRSGSTLLKALLAQAPDISDLPETDFQKFAGKADRTAVEKLSENPILVLKRPAWFNEVSRYPQLPGFAGVKRIVLVRDAYAFGLSARRMVFRHLPWLQRAGWGNRFLVEHYWARLNRRLLALVREDPRQAILVRYEDLLADPVAHTARLFAFLGSTQTEGVSAYDRPRGYHWRWGRDDGGAVIQSLKVQPPRPVVLDDRRLLQAIKKSAATLNLRQDLGYPPLP